MTANISEIIAKLKAAEAALPDPRDARSENDRAAWWATRHEHAMTISGLMNDPQDLQREELRLADLEARRVATVEKLAAIENAVITAPDWRSFADGRDRDKEYDRQQNLKLQLRRLHEGYLFRSDAPGITYERLDFLDLRIADVKMRIARLRASLDSHVRQAEVLLKTAVSEVVTS
jgi:hypothetical protein